MKRTNVVLDEDTLEEAVRLSGERTYSAAINRALGEMVARIRARQAIESLHGMGEIFWPGYAAEMAGRTPARLAVIRDEERKAPAPRGSGRGRRGSR